MNDILQHLATDIDYAVQQLERARNSERGPAEDAMRRASDALERVQSFLRQIDNALAEVLVVKGNATDAHRAKGPPPEIEL